MEEVKNYLKELGYEESDIEKIIGTYGIVNLKPETLLNNIKRIYEFLNSFGYSREDIIKMTKSEPGIYSLNIEYIKQILAYMEKVGYSREDIIDMTKKHPKIYGYIIENIKQILAYMEKVGYSREDIIDMTKSQPGIYSLSIENIKQKIADMEELGYSREDIIKMTKSLPSIYGFSIEDIKQILAYMEELGYSREDIIKIAEHTTLTKDMNKQSQKEGQAGTARKETVEEPKAGQTRTVSTQKLGIETIEEQNNTELIDNIATTLAGQQNEIESESVNQEKRED